MQTDMECKGKTYLWSQIFFISTTTILLIATNILHVHCHVHEPHLCTFLQPRQHKLRQAIATQHRIKNLKSNHVLSTLNSFFILSYNPQLLISPLNTSIPTPVPLPNSSSLRPYTQTSSFLHPHSSCLTAAHTLFHSNSKLNERH